MFVSKGGCAGTIVGDKKVRGISGGEKKRLSIACELIASPSVIFADEPTTGNKFKIWQLYKLRFSWSGLKTCSLRCCMFFRFNWIFVHEYSGLDAFQAEQVMETLRELAHDGHTVICSIHQPRGSIYAKFDDLMLLSNGSLVYMGPAGEKALTYFESIGWALSQSILVL